jgi:hypothetical protein
MAMAAVNSAIAQDMLRDCLGAGASVIPGCHFRDDLKKEGLTMPAAWHVLRLGCITNPPEHDVRTGDWKYSVEGYEPDGKWLVIVFCFRAVNKAYLITVFSVQARERA